MATVIEINEKHDWKHKSNFFEGRVCFVPGGTGSLGSVVVRLLLERGCSEVRTLSQSESKIVRLRSVCSSDRLKTSIGSICDKEVLQYCTKGVDYVIDCHALKHIDICDANPWIAIRTNIVGTHRLLSVCDRNDVKVAMLVSTDKAVNPTTVYGMTKKLQEEILLEMMLRTDNRLLIVRGGNLVGSSQSVIPRWFNELGVNNSISVTDPEMTRFVIQIPEFANFILWVLEDGRNGKIYIPEMKAIRLGDLATAMLEAYGNEDSRVFIRGSRRCEKIHEELWSDDDLEVEGSGPARSSETAERMTENEILAMLKICLRPYIATEPKTMARHMPERRVVQPV